MAPQNFTGVRNATWFGNACPQQPVLGPNETLPDNPGLNGVTQYLGELQPHGIVAASEDCMFACPSAGSFAHTRHPGLYLNVVRPAGVSEGAKLPVVVVSWLFYVVLGYSSHPFIVDIWR